MSAIRAAISGIGAWVPEDRLTNADLEAMVATSAEWIVSRTGIHERRILREPGCGASYMAIKAVEELLERAQISALEVDGLIVTTVTPDHKFPSTASLVCGALGLGRAFAFDLNATCSGFLYALEVGRRFIESGAYPRIIVVSSEMMSSITDYRDRSSCILFGDGAAAVLLEPSRRFGIEDIMLGCDGAGAKNIIVRGGGSALPLTAENLDEGLQYFWQDGTVVFKHAVQSMEAACAGILARNNLGADDVRWAVAHQANLRIITSVAQRLKLPPEKMLENVQTRGNTSSASVPLCLYDHREALAPGDRVLLTAFGSGYTWGSALLTWGADLPTDRA
jgi:3-oxoacyl-[acyl-carrier-protein] synthase-3